MAEVYASPRPVGSRKRALDDGGEEGGGGNNGMHQQQHNNGGGMAAFQSSACKRRRQFGEDMNTRGASLSFKGGLSEGMRGFFGHNPY